jgi:translation initiation factor 5
MSRMINVRGLKENLDPSYRYKMPSVSINKQKTKMVMINLKEISASLSRHPIFILDFLKKKFSTGMKYDEKENRVEFKSLDIEQIQNAIFEFIEYFVLCPTCGNPETILSQKKNVIYIQCRACPHYDKVNISNKIVEKVCDTLAKYIE